jgi:Flp pilus assembly protein TadG
VLASLVSRCWARRDERGASAVEFALLVPLVVMLLIGTVSTGLTYSDHLALTNAAREGARYGAAADGTLGTWATSTQSRVQQVYFNAAGTAPTDDQVCVKLVQAGGAVISQDLGSGCGTQPALPTMSAGSCAVVVWMSKPAVIQLAVVPDIHTTLEAQSVAFYGRTVDTRCTAK